MGVGSYCPCEGSDILVPSPTKDTPSIFSQYHLLTCLFAFTPLEKSKKCISTGKPLWGRSIISFLEYDWCGAFLMNSASLIMEALHIHSIDINNIR